MSTLDRILELAHAANSWQARTLLSGIRREIMMGADVAPWIRAIQLARDLAAIDADAAFFLLDVLTEEAMGQRIDEDPELRDIAAKMEAIERREGLVEGEAFIVNDAPADWQALNRHWERQFDTLRAELFRQNGEPQMAMDLALHPKGYDLRSKQGWQQLMAIEGEDDPF